MARVLLIEDDATIRHLIRDVLTEDGLDVIEAPDGMSGYELVRQTAPDAVVLDLFLPRMDGEEFLNLSRMLPNGAALPVVVLSASDRVPVDKRVRAFLKKPFDLHVLSQTVQSVIPVVHPS